MNKSLDNQYDDVNLRIFIRSLNWASFDILFFFDFLKKQRAGSKRSVSLAGRKEPTKGQPKVWIHFVETIQQHSTTCWLPTGGLSVGMVALDQIKQHIFPSKRVSYFLTIDH